MKKIKNHYFSENAPALGYKMSITCQAENLPYYRICGAKD